MIGVIVTFDHGDDGFDRARVLGVAEAARGMFDGMPDLRFKFFTFDEKHHVAQNFYVWDSKDAAERFCSRELTERVTGLSRRADHRLRGDSPRGRQDEPIATGPTPATADVAIAATGTR